MTTPALANEAQSLSPSAYVTLFQLDALALGGAVYAFTQSAAEGGPLVFGGVTYTPVDIEAEGFEWTGSGPLPRPKIRITNVNRAFSALVGAYGDLLGAQLTRIRTFRRFLDDQPDADPSAHFPLDIYRFDRKSVQNKVFVEWELAAAIDQQNRMLPGRQLLRDNCDRSYRRWTGSGFDYSQATCPYSGAACFNAFNEPTGNPAEDMCSQFLSGCRKRFGAEPLPFGGFPGVASVRGS
ncbi:phage minor tail protein L [Azospirillum doebereinerae]|uniref:phage minor tail protein L n=1 Tax=Azospirillum doebereinerae TaxID=92933 RepID=UPI001EE5C930|nr:phage minor tail protein L [Azospirillum doebereinerae]MCG5242344.1 phage minor tail protein L [Azospirillum doebereinerae]